jgi:acylphosphatase
MPARIERYVVLFSGDVQGVGFRFSTLHVARAFPEVGGYVRNLADGRVELVAEGPAESVRDFLAAVRQEMRECIRGEAVSVEPATREFTGFRIER